MQGAVSGGSAVSGDDLFAVAGIREPGLDEPLRDQRRLPLLPRRRRRVHDDIDDRAPDGDAVTALRPRQLSCTDEPCVVDFGINDPPAGTEPAVFVQFTADPLRHRRHRSGPRCSGRLGPPGLGGRRAGATRFGVFLSARDDDPFGGGGLVCSWAEGEDGCSGTAIPRFAPSYNRLSVLAIVDETTEPTLSDGADRLVRTLSFDPPLRRGGTVTRGEPP